MNPGIQRALDRTLPTRSGRVRRRIMAACLMILSVVATRVVLLRREVPENDAPRVVAVGDLKTNGEHWVIFRFDAPKNRAAHIMSVQVIGSDNIPLITFPKVTSPAPVGGASALSIPDSTVPISELVKAGRSKKLKVRHAGGEEWRVRLCLAVGLGFQRLYAARIEGCWRSKSLKPWTRNYVERNYRIIESETVSTTTDSAIPRLNPATPPSPITPWSPMDEIFSRSPRPD